MEIAKVFTGKLNLDNVIEAVPDGDYTYMIDGVIGTSKDGKRGSVENMMGTSALTGTADLDANSVCIGGCRDAKTNDYYLFFYNTNASKNTIVKVVVQNNNGTISYTVSKILTWSGLNFWRYNKIESCYVNGYLYFTDDLNGIRGFNVSKYISSSPSAEEDISLMKRGGIYAPVVAKEYDSTLSLNLIEKQDFQFAYQYVYEDGQLSVLSPYSKLVRRNLSTENYNRIRITLPEAVPSLVKIVKFAVRVGNTGSFQYIGSLEKVNGSLPTNDVLFFNSVYGGIVETDYLNLYHDVPLTSKTIEFIKNRLFIGNITTGLDTIKDIPLTITTTATNLQLNSTQIISATFNEINQYTYQATNETVNGQPQIRLQYNSTSTTGVKLYQGSNQGSWTVGGKSVSLVSGAYEIQNANYQIGGDINNIAVSLGIYPYGTNQYVYLPPYSLTTGTHYSYRLGSSFTGSLRVAADPNAVAAYSGYSSFPNGSQYKFGIVFKDEFGRYSSVSVVGAPITTSSKDYSNLISASWSLPTSNTAQYIPLWAKSYHIVRSMNLTKSMFFEFQTVRILYYNSTNTFTTWSADRTGIKIDITPITNTGIGYTFESGDRIVLYKPDGTNTYNLPIKSYTDGFIYLDNKNIGNVTSYQNIAFEIYRPNIVTEDLLYYEIGEGYSITSAGTANRSFSVTSGTINGDVYNAALTTYTYNGTAYVDGNLGLFKEMSIDVTDRAWNTDIGKPNLESDIGQVIRQNTIKYSAPVITNTEINGLSEFYSAEQGIVPFECGEINKLKSSSRIASNGSVLLAICTNKTASVYVDEVRLNINNEINYIVQGTNVIGEINVLNGSYGTVHPSSVVDDGTYVYWFSKSKRAFVRYGNNGIFPVSEYGVVDYFEDSALLHPELDETYNPYGDVVGGYFPFYDMIITSFPNQDSGKNTISFMNKDNAWRGFYSFIGDYYFDVNDTFFSVKYGTIYRHNNTSAFGSFYGTQYPTIIEVPINNSVDTPKHWRSAELFLSPNFIAGWTNGSQSLAQYSLSIQLSNEDGQYTDINWNEFEVGEYIAYAPFKKDSNSTGGIINGDDMVSRTAKLKIIFSGSSLRYVPMVKIGFIPSLGHTL